MIKTLVAQVVCLLGCFIAIAQNNTVDLKEVTITDSRFERPASKKSRSVTLLTTKDIEPYVGSTLAALLNDQVGIHINGSNAHPGSELSYFIRGGNNRQVLFLIDGVPVSDPTQIENDFDLRTIDISTIESIEIIRGAASSLYGSAAATAVIKITTKRLNTQGLHGSIRTIFGTNNDQKKFSAAPNHQNRQVQLSLGNEFNAGSISLLDQRTLGMSSVVGDENDATKKQNLGLRYQLQLLPQFSVNAFFNQNYFSSQYDDS
ncbi:MAG: TonB-dependent receptor, partial [Flavobacteriaceae bacterium]